MILPDIKLRGLYVEGSDLRTIRTLLQGPTAIYAAFNVEELNSSHLVKVATLRRMSQAGHFCIALVSGATCRMPVAEATPMILKLSRQIHLLTGCPVVNNFKWMREIPFINFLRNVGKHFRVKEMLRDKHDGVSYSEFSDLLIQAYDTVHMLSKGCRLQIGEWPRIQAGIELSRAMVNREMFGFTLPEIAGAMPIESSAYAWYQFWLNQDDIWAEKCLRYLTNRDLVYIRMLQPGALQQILAEDMTLWTHGQQGLIEAQNATDILFGKEIASPDGLQEIFKDVPNRIIPRVRLTTLTVTEAFIESKLCRSNNEVRRLIEQGGAYVNNKRVEANAPLGPHLLGDMLVLRSGKKRYALLRFQ